MDKKKWDAMVKSLIQVTEESGGVEGKIRMTNTKYGWDILITVIHPDAVEYLEKKRDNDVLSEKVL